MDQDSTERDAEARYSMDRLGRSPERRPRKYGVPLLVLAIVVVAGGLVTWMLTSDITGGASKDEYKAGLRKVEAQLDDSSEASRAAAGTVDEAARREQLGAAQAALAKAAKTAEGLDAPDDVAAAHKQLVTALRDYAALFDRLARLDAGDPAEAELYSEAGAIVRRLEQANAAIDKAGYSVRSGD